MKKKYVKKWIVYLSLVLSNIFSVIWNIIIRSGSLLGVYKKVLIAENIIEVSFISTINNSVVAAIVL